MIAAQQDNTIRLLVVDDDQREYDLLTTVIQGMAGYAAQVHRCSNWKGAQTALAAERFDALLINCRLESLEDGTTVLASLPAPNEDTPVLFLTPMTGSRERAVSIGVVDYLEQGPAGSSMLERTLRHAIERKRSQCALRESDQRYRALVSTLSQIVWRTNPAGDVIEAEGWEALTGQPLDDMRANGWLSCIHPGDAEACAPVWKRALEHRTPYHFEYRIRNTAGTYRWHRVDALPVPGSGAIREWLGVTVDVHERREAEEQLTRANARLHDVISLQSELAPGMERDDIMRLVCGRVVDLLGADIAGVAEPDGDEFQYLVFLGTVPSETRPRLHQNASLTGWCWKQQQSVKCDDVTRDARASAAAQDVLGAKSLLLAPVLSKGVPVAVLTAISSRARAFCEEDLSFLELLAGILGSALANREANRERQLLLAERSAALVRSTRTEELFRALAEHSDEVIYIADLDGTMRYVSPSMTRLFGWKPEEVVGSNAMDWPLPEDRHLLAEAMRQIAGTAGKSNAVTVRVRHKDGRVRYLEMSGRNLAHIPAVAGLAANGRDVTARVEAARALEFKAKLLQTVQQAVIALDVDRRVTYWNAYAEVMYGWRADEVMGRQLREFLMDDSQHAMADSVISQLGAGRAWSGDFELKRKDGTRFTAYVINTPIYSPEGVLTGFVGVSTDITERRQLEEQLRQSQKLQAVGELAGGVAHDFNNVLTAITSYSELLMQDEASEERLGDLREIRSAARRAAELTRKLLAFSRRQVMQVQVLEVGEVVRSMEKMLSRVISEDIILDTSYPAGGVFVEADPTQLEQVLLNLVVNARDAMPEGGTIGIRLAVENDQCVLRVRDSGIGMTDETRARLFEPFFTTKPVGKGTGLGLAVVYGIVQQFKGTIDVKSAPGAGAEFIIRLPLSREAMAARTEERPASRAEGSETILIAEDNAVLLDLARRILAQQGYTVICASTAAEAIRVLCDGQKVDLLISDVVMPDMRGPELVDRLAADGVEPRLLFTSGYAADACTQCLEDPQARFLAKPWTPRDLLEAVREALDAPRREMATDAD